MSGPHHGHHFSHVHWAHWLEHWDGRTRILALLSLALAVALTSRLEGAAAGFGVVTALAMAGRLPPGFALARLRVLALFVVPLLVIVPFHRSVDSLSLVEGWAWGPTWEGSQQALLMTLRILGASLAALLALGVGPIDRTIRSLQDLGVPLVLVHMTLLAYRYIYVFSEDLAHMRAALASRGFVARADARTLVTSGQLVGGLLVRSLDRTERIDAAMRCRGFDGRLRTLGGGRVRVTDVAVMLAVMAVAAVLTSFDREVGWAWLMH